MLHPVEEDRDTARRVDTLLPDIAAISASTIVEWLAGDDCHAMDEAELISGLGYRLRAIGVPVDRLALHLMTLHPEYFGTSIAWTAGEPVNSQDRHHGSVSLAFMDSAISQAIRMRRTVVAGRTGMGASWQCLETFAGRDLMQVIVIPLCNCDGSVSTASFATQRPTGFTAGERQILERIIPALRNACELRTLRKIGDTMLDTYIGPYTAQRIRAGHIRQGEVESIDAALLLCDLRGFTELSNNLPPREIMQFLNCYFDRVVPAITSHGGEVAKFMGDAVLAFFPGYSAVWAAASAYNAAMEILARTAETHDVRMHVGIALHYGEVNYGNLGSGGRLDFTLIGPDVNLVSRIQHVCSEEGHQLLMSRAFMEAQNDENERQSIGCRELKGFESPVELFQPLDRVDRTLTTDLLRPGIKFGQG
ncbi:adenylate/guanylate cyclase domain-containing protein [Rhizobium sp. Root1220]|uniref:adenylate/guanylate cyclase domain-containing protein n=1 Tax=Rhizobium sp. Root1220 TaxID=1736432 RepID=UPI0006FDCF30|nr:adenylate/guanylate cyclase domain-containing protein [Rhizobium sp. Root1220]KQV79604.1 adenylate cyclase [Rhizobium sp. Root1220]